MNDLEKKMLRRIRAKGRNKWVFTSHDFLDLGSRVSITRALSKLTKSDYIRRVDRGYYVLPYYSVLLKRYGTPNVDQVVKAFARRNNVLIMPSGISAANLLRLTPAVPGKNIYFTSGKSQLKNIAGWQIHFRHAPRRILDWYGKPASLVVLAFDWLGPNASRDKIVIPTLKRILPNSIKSDLRKNTNLLPKWMVPFTNQIVN